MDKYKYMDLLNGIQTSFFKEIESTTLTHMNKAGLYYRTFSRVKTAESAYKKIESKNSPRYKMQDLFGLRIALYFHEDINICCSIISNVFDVVDPSIDKVTTDSFKATRLNYVCKLPNNIANRLDESIWGLQIDKTFEIQIRTIFSEGWHEVEHDLRYKSKEDWESQDESSRRLNGIYATLETCDWAIGRLFDDLAYQKYKCKQWESMLKNQLKIHITNEPISERIRTILNIDPTLAKELYRINRADFLQKLSNSRLGVIPKKCDNIIFIANALYIKNEDLLKITPPQILEIVYPSESM